MNEVDYTWLIRPESQVVEERYRLHAANLQRRKRRVRITNVTYQGVERVRFVLHFAELAKPLPLNRAQCWDVIRSTGSGNVSDWIGQTITLAPDMQNGQRTICIGPARAPGLSPKWTSTKDAALGAVAATADHTGGGSMRTAILLALLLALLLGLIYMLEQSGQNGSLFGL